MRSSLTLLFPVLVGALIANAAVAQVSGVPIATDVMPAPPRIAFKDISQDAGVVAFTRSNTDHSGGVAWIDYNGDFWPDIFLSNGLGYDHWLFRNNGDGTFSDVSSIVAKPNVSLESCASHFGDFDNDGDSDLLVIVDSPIPGSYPFGGPNLLYINNGDGTFTEDGLSRGVIDALGRRNDSAALADFDRDGDLDIFIGVRIALLFPLNHFDWYARNEGGAIFSDATAGTGLAGQGRNAQVALPFDANLDGWMDIFVGNAGEQSAGYSRSDSFEHIYLNDTTGTAFADMIGTSTSIGNDASAAMGSDIGDVDNDGDWDLYMTDIPNEGAAPLGNVLYLGDGSGGFTDNSCDVAGICTSANTWPCNFADFDQDGWVDLWVGSTRPGEDDFVFRNIGDGTFSSVPQAEMKGNKARGGSVADYDGDGDVDIMFWNSEQNSLLYRNEGDQSKHWLGVKLLGTTSNRDAIGALVRVTSGGQTQMRRVSGGDSAHSQRELILNFGLGESTLVDSLQVDWPSGLVETFTKLTTDELLFLEEGSGVLAETITELAATWSMADQVVCIEIRSSFGGRTAFDIPALGPLPWSSSTLSFANLFPGVTSNPGTVSINSRRGVTYQVTVTTIP